jgi:hypothetical protein
VEPELNCLRVRSRSRLALWATETFGFSPTWSKLQFVEEPDYFASHVTQSIYSVVGQSGECRTVRLLHFWAASPTVRQVLKEWRREFGAGLPRDHGVAVTFER